MQQRTRAEIDLSHLSHNFGAIAEAVAPATVIPVVKADAYGHGAVAAARSLSRAGASLFAVAQFAEAMTLRDSGIREPVLIFGRLFPDEIGTALRAGFRLTVFGEEDLDWIEHAAADRPAPVHVNVDTGMGRIGVTTDRAPALFDRLAGSRLCRWEGVYSHFATSDEADKSYALRQMRRFDALLARLKEKDRLPPMVHMANSGAVLDIPASRYTAVRPGLLLYGYYPSGDVSRSIPLRQVMAFRTRVAHLRELPADSSVSYGRRWSTPDATRIAVLPVGYADGVRRDLTHRGSVRINGKRYPMVGTVTMDHIMVHVGDDAVRPGDEALLWGGEGEEAIRVLDVASSIGTIPYELTCGVSRRVPRVYLGGSGEASP